jgi:hypothetical protein
MMNKMPYFFVTRNFNEIYFALDKKVSVIWIISELI